MTGDDMGYRIHHLMEIAPLMEGWMRKQAKNDIFHQAAKLGIPVGPLFTAKEVMEDPQYAARNYFVEVEHPVAGKFRYPGWPLPDDRNPAESSKAGTTIGSA